MKPQNLGPWSGGSTRRVASGTSVFMAMLLVAHACVEVDQSSRGGSGHTPATLVFADRPELNMGVLKGEDPFLFHGVSDAMRLSDGTVVVADCRSGELRYFAQDGSFIRTVGGRGEGPAEFTLLSRLFPLEGDTIGAHDRSGLRTTIFSPEGDLAATVPIGPITPHLPDVLGRLANGSFVVRRVGFRSTQRVGVPIRITASLTLLDGSGSTIDSVVGLPSSDVIAVSDRGPVYSLKLSRHAVFAVHPEGIFYGDQSGDIIEFDSDLRPVDTIHPITQSEPVDDEAMRAFEKMLEEEADRPDDGIGPAYGGAYAPMMPAHGHIVFGRAGRLWVQDPLRPNHYPLIWTAYYDGVAAARVELAPRFFPFEFGRDWVLGVSFDELTVERIQLWRLVPGELSGDVLPPRDAEPPTVARCGAWASR